MQGWAVSRSRARTSQEPDAGESQTRASADAESLHGPADAESFKTELLPLFTTLSADEQDSVRLLAVENCVSVGKL